MGNSNRISIKPLSVNVCWQGKRFKTIYYKRYEQLLLRLLPDEYLLPTGKIEARFKFGFSSKAQDLDNVLKPMIDILQKAYGFNDKKIYKIVAEKVDVKKGEEFVEFSLAKYTT